MKSLLLLLPQLTSFARDIKGNTKAKLASDMLPNCEIKYTSAIITNGIEETPRKLGNESLVNILRTEPSNIIAILLVIN